MRVALRGRLFYLSIFMEITSELRSPLEFALTTGVSGASECQRHCDTTVAGSASGSSLQIASQVMSSCAP